MTTTTPPLWLCETTGQPVSQHDCLNCAEYRRVAACPFPPTMLRALANSIQGDDTLVEAKQLAREKGITLLRVTSLLGCTRQAWYGQHGRPPLEKPSEHWTRFRGSIFHAALESLAGAQIVAETRLIASLEAHGVSAWIAGKVDHYDPALRLLTDYKTVNSYGKKLAHLGLPKQHHVAQLWIYAWLLGRSGLPTPTTGRIVYMDMGSVCTVDVPMPAAAMQVAVAARLVEKARTITEAGPTGPAGDPLEAWECRYCAFAAQCPCAGQATGK